jgi:poly-gamma-glutamate capsule biosynthesis protein CapA/YwtB (metallophosphatase superfamily)
MSEYHPFTDCTNSRAHASPLHRICVGAKHWRGDLYDYARYFASPMLAAGAAAALTPSLLPSEKV